MFNMETKDDDMRIFAYRKKGLSEEVVETERVWQLVNFMSCVHSTGLVRKQEWSPVEDMCRLFTSSFQAVFEPALMNLDKDFRLLSKLLKCITFVQDMNQCTNMSEILGDKAKYVVKEALGKPIFTGSSEEGLALFGNEALDQDENYDKLDSRLHHDIDVMYESDKMVAYELIDSLFPPVNATGVLNVLMRPGQKAGYVTLQKILPKSVAMKIKGDSMLKAVKVYPKPEEYVGQELLMLYIQALAFLVASESDFLPRQCNCPPPGNGANSNRYGDLCYDCKRLTLREIPRGKDVSPTKIWSDTVMIQGPAIHENAIIENSSCSTSSTAPLNKGELQEKYEDLLKELSGKRPNVTVLPSVKPELGDMFSSSERKLFFIDHVPAVKCIKWPSAAWEFTVRQRPSGWPPKDVIQEIVATGCHVVPRSTKPPPETKMRQATHSILNTQCYVDWRLSFSQAEKILASNLNMAQMKCYLLLKILNDKVTDDVRRDRDDDDDDDDKSFYLDSYCLKTTFFWVCEEIPLEQWEDDNLGACLFKVLEKLILFLKAGTIPNYFIPSSNLIEPRSKINIGTRLSAVYDIIYHLKMFRDKHSKEIFEVLHTAVWNKLWECSQKKPPGCTPQDLAFVIKALREENHERWKETYCKFDWFFDHTPKKISREGIPSDAVQNMPITDLVLAQIFEAISKFLYANGNIHGKGFNTARAAFYEEEARNLLPEGCSLDDLPEYKLPDTSPSPSVSPDSSDSSDYEFEEEDL